MKRVFKYLTIIALAAFAISCENGDNNELPNNPVEKECYRGTMKVDQNDGTYYTQSGVEVDFEILNDKLNFVMYKVKFAAGMPLKLDMVVEGVDYIAVDGHYTLSGDGIVPYAMGGPFEKFTITELEGAISSEEMTLRFMCGEHFVEYNATK